MERDHQLPKQQENTSLLSSNPKAETVFTDQPPKNIITNTNDRLKRDEWSEGAVATLLEAYEAKWTLRNRAKLKGQDWEDVAKHVSARANGTKSAKTQTQCKNKIESMKKRYRSESAAADASSWPLYPRLDLLLRGNGPAPATAAAGAALNPPPPLLIMELPSALPPPPPPPAAAAAAATPAILEVGSVAQNSHGSNDGDRLAKEERDGGKIRAEKNPIDEDETESSSRAIQFQKERKGNLKRRRGEYMEIAESIRWAAEVVAKSEQARMETMREIERIRADAETKRAEMDLKRTEIIANTHLHIAKLFAKPHWNSNNNNNPT